MTDSDRENIEMAIDDLIRHYDGAGAVNTYKYVVCALSHLDRALGGDGDGWRSKTARNKEVAARRKAAESASIGSERTHE